MLSSITNTLLDDHAWMQASLPVKSGGLGIRSAVHLAPSAYLASFAGCRELTFTILPPHFQESPLSLSAITEWSTGHNEPPPSGPMSHRQKSWDLPRVSSIAAELLTTAPDPLSKARLLSASKKESDSWLHTLPVTSLGLCMDDNTIHTGIGIRLGAPLCIPHLCHHWGSNVDTLGTHGLSCRFSAGHFRHAMLNDILCSFSTRAHWS